MMKEKKISVQKNMLYNSVGSFFYLLCQWLVTVLVVRISSNGFQDAGILSLCMSITNIFFTMAAFGIRTYQVSDINDEFRAIEYITGRFLTCAVGIGLCILFVLVNGQYSAYQAICIIVYMLYRVLEALIDVGQGVQQKAWRMDTICVSFVLRGIGMLAGFCLILHFTDNILFAIVGMCVVTLLVMILYDTPIVSKLANLKETIRKKKIWQLHINCWPLMVHQLLLTSFVSVPRYFLENIQGSEVLGIYASVATPTVIIQTICNWIYIPLIPLFAKHYEKKRYKAFVFLFLKIVAALLGFTVVIIIGTTVFGEWGLKLLLGEKILPYVYLLNPIIITTILMAMSYLYGMIYTVLRRQKTLMICNAISLLLNGVISKFIIQKCGVDGVNYVLYISLGINILLLTACFIGVLIRESKKNNDMGKGIRE